MTCFSHYQATLTEVERIMKVLENFCASADDVALLHASAKTEPSPEDMAIVPWRGTDTLDPAPVCDAIVKAPSRAPSRSVPMV